MASDSDTQDPTAESIHGHGACPDTAPAGLGADLRNAPEMVDLALGAAGIGLWQLDLQSGILHLDERARAHYWLPCSDVPVAEARRNVHPDDRQDLMERVAAATSAETGERQTIEYRVVHADGSVRWLSVGVQVCFEGDGPERRAVTISGTTQDVTERRRAEHEAQVARAQLEAALESMNDAVFISDVDGSFIEFNEAFATFHKFAGKGECARTLAEYPEFVEVRLEDGVLAPLELWAVPRALRGEKGQCVEYGLRRKDTGEEWVGSYSFAPIRDAQGTVTGSVVVARDVTERKRSQEELRRRAADLELIHTMTTAVLSGDDLAQSVRLLSSGLRDVFDCTSALIGLAEEAGAPLAVRSYDIPESMRADIEDVLGRRLASVHLRVPTGDGDLCTEILEAGLLYVTEDEAVIKRMLAELTDDEALRRHVEEVHTVLGITSLVVIPLVSGTETLGIVELARAVPFTEAELRRVQVIAGQLSIAVNRKRAADALRESERHFRNLVRVVPDAILVMRDGRVAFINEAGCELLAAASAAEVLGTPLLDLFAADCRAGVQARIALVETAGSTLPLSEERLVRFDGALVDVELVAAPFMDQGAVSTLVVIGDITKRKLAEARVARQLRQLTALRDVDIAIMGATDVRLALTAILDHVTVQQEVDAASVLLFDPHSLTLDYIAGHGFVGDAITRTSCRLGQGVAGRVALEREMAVIHGIAAHADDFGRAALLADEGFSCYYGIPLVAKGRLSGVLELFSRRHQERDDAWRGFLEILAGQIAIAIDNASLYDGLQRSAVELQLAYDATIEGWSRAMDLRDKETEGHTERVTDMTLTLARAAGMSGEELMHVRRGALLHDMGKLGVPDSILLKPDKLSEDEWAIMRQHPKLAYDMLAPISYLRSALDIPYCHHEKWDGTGYPRGLSGEQIPLSARLFALVDVWDALNSDRPYRPAWSPADARAYIAEQAGKHFDPSAVELFLATIDTTQRGT